MSAGVKLGLMVPVGVIKGRGSAVLVWPADDFRDGFPVDDDASLKVGALLGWDEREGNVFDSSELDDSGDNLVTSLDPRLWYIGEGLLMA